jgi:hypothetical protein
MNTRVGYLPEIGSHTMQMMHYRSLAIMAALSFVAMFTLMYAMVDAFPNVVINVNQFYMAALMTAPMIIIELALMWHMYENKRLNVIILGVSAAALVLFFLLIRYQAAVGDTQLLRSMIPHHASAILMCKQAALEDAEVKKLCQDIIASQEAEVAQMKAKLAPTR